MKNRSKITPLYNAFRKDLKLIPLEEIHSVDEQMIPFKGRMVFKKYLNEKPYLWGRKVFFHVGISGVVYDIEILGKELLTLVQWDKGPIFLLRLVQEINNLFNFI